MSEEMYMYTMPEYHNDALAAALCLSPHKSAIMSRRVLVTVKDAPEPPPAPVPMTREYAATMVGRCFSCPWALKEICFVGERGVRDNTDGFTLYTTLAAHGKWYFDGTPCAMPQRKDGEG